jgi:hypothetical protein
MKKTTKNPITFFREANEKRQAAVKNSLKKAQAGGYMFQKAKPAMGPLTETQAALKGMKESMNDPMSDGRGPRTTTPREDMLNQPMDPSVRLRNSEPVNDTTPGEIFIPSEKYKKGGSAKPSAGLSKKTKSNIAKKASAGKDIGKKGKGFAKVAAAAGGGEKGKRIAAAAMWKNIKRG